MCAELAAHDDERRACVPKEQTASLPVVGEAD
jgi:hypothetical protein